MLNKYEHLDTGLTVIFCENTQKNIVEEVFIDTDMFNYIRGFNVEWKIWDANNKKENDERLKTVGGTNIETSKILNLKRVIGEYLHGEGFHFTLLNNNYYDHRKKNIFKFNVGTGHSTKVRLEKKALLAKLEPIKTKKDIVNPNNNVQVIEYQDKLLILENSKVVVELNLKQANAVKQFLENS